MNKPFIILTLLSSVLYLQTSAMLKNELALVTKAISATKSHSILSQKDNAHTYRFFSTSLQQKIKTSLKKELKPNLITENQIQLGKGHGARLATGLNTLVSATSINYDRWFNMVEVAGCTETSLNHNLFTSIDPFLASGGIGIAAAIGLIILCDDDEEDSSSSKDNTTNTTKEVDKTIK